MTALVSGLALATLGGCSGSQQRVTTMSGYSSPAQGTEAEMARLSSARLGENQPEGDPVLDAFVQDASNVQLPQRHLSEAWDATSRTNARRAAADASMLRAEATHNERLAIADAAHISALGDNEISMSSADRLSDVYAAKIEEAEVHAVAREIGVAIEAQRQNQLLDAAAMEWRSDVDKLRAAAGAEWTRAQAEHQRMVSERIAVEARGIAQIDQMQTVAARTAERGRAKATALRTEASTVREQTAARVAELRQRIDTVEQNTRAGVSELRERASSSLTEGQAHAMDLRARATAIEEQDVDETFRLELAAAEASFNRSKAEAERLFQAATALEEEMEAEFTRRFSVANTQSQIDATDFNEAIEGITSYVAHGQGEIARLRVEAERIEREGRADFVRAEAEAAAEAIRETSRHQWTLAEEAYQRLRAEAEAEAARVRSEHLAVLAQQRASGEVTVPGRNEPVEPNGRSNDANPEIQGVPHAAPRIDPDHVAAFKASLARASSLRIQAEAQENSLYATAEERRAGFESWRDRQNAAHDAAVADANTFKRQTQASIDEFVAQAEALMSRATAQLGNAKMTAEAKRRESLASMTTMLADAEAVEKKAVASNTQLTASADATERNGQSESRALRVSLDSESRRGDATVKRLLAEASSLEQSQQAILAQMGREIDSAQRILSSEIAKLDQAAQSFYEVAEANFAERESEIAMLTRVNEATRVELAAANAAQMQIDQAETARLREVNKANQLVADAAVGRARANADAEFGFASAADTLSRAQAGAELAIAQAGVQEQIMIAGSEERTTRALFDSRIISTLAQRDRSYANVWLEGEREEARRQQAVALAAAYQELSAHAMSRLDEQTNDFNQAAQDNWHSALAMPSPLPEPIDPSLMGRDAEQFLQIQPVVSVPTNDD